MENFEHFIACGFMFYEGFVPLYYNTETKEVVYESEVDGDLMAVGDVDIDNPLQMYAYDGFAKAVQENKAGGAIGFIFKDDEEVIAILNADTAETRSLYEMYKPTGNTLQIDLNFVAIPEE